MAKGKRGDLLISLSAGNSQAQQATLTGDTYINPRSGATNYGANVNVFVGNGIVSLFSFDVSVIPAGNLRANIANATLTLYENRLFNAGPVDIVPVAGAWTESSVNFFTNPGVGPIMTTVNLPAQGSYLSVDVTSMIRQWV